MTSEINVSDLNTNYPITGINNDTKGFRDNFTIIKNNLVIASREISDLQSNTVLITRNNAPVINDLQGSTLENGKLSAMVGAVYAPVAHASGSLSINFNNGPLQLFTLSGNITALAFAGWPTTSDYAYIRIHFTCSGYNRNVTIPAPLAPKKIIYETGTATMVVEKDAHLVLDVWSFDGGDTIFVQTHRMNTTEVEVVGFPSLHLSDIAEPTRSTTVGSLTSSGGACFEGNLRILSTTNPTVSTSDAALMVGGGAVIEGRLFVNTSITVNGAIIRPSYTGHEKITTGLIDVTLYSATLFTHTGASTASMNAGIYDGQIKTLVNTTAHTMTVSVVNPGWSNDATAQIAFTAIGNTCTLQYLDNSWYCIGNSGVTF